MQQIEIKRSEELFFISQKTLILKFLFVVSFCSSYISQVQKKHFYPFITQKTKGWKNETNENTSECVVPKKFCLKMKRINSKTQYHKTAEWLCNHAHSSSFVVLNRLYSNAYLITTSKFTKELFLKQFYKEITCNIKLVSHLTTVMHLSTNKNT